MAAIFCWRLQRCCATSNAVKGRRHISSLAKATAAAAAAATTTTTATAAPDNNLCVPAATSQARRARPARKVFLSRDHYDYDTVLPLLAAQQHSRLPIISLVHWRRLRRQLYLVAAAVNCACVAREQADSKWAGKRASERANERANEPPPARASGRVGATTIAQELQVAAAAAAAAVGREFARCQLKWSSIEFQNSSFQIILPSVASWPPPIIESPLLPKGSSRSNNNDKTAPLDRCPVAGWLDRSRAQLFGCNGSAGE